MASEMTDGITHPPIDELLDKAGSKYSLVLYAAKRARQINAYYSQLGEGLLEYVGPLVETYVHEKPLSNFFFPMSHFPKSRRPEQHTHAKNFE